MFSVQDPLMAPLMASVDTFVKNFKRICTADVTVQFIPLSYCRREKRILKIIMFNEERGNVA